MANVLDLLWDLVERPNERTEYLQDPAGYVHARGRSDLTSEEVTAALDLIRDLVPADLAAAIESRVGSSPKVTARADEAPFEVAIRSLSEVVASVDGHGEAGPRPDPKDISLTAVPPDPETGETDAPEVVSSDDDAGLGFDPTALEVDADAARPPEVVEPLLPAAAHSPFDPDALVVVSEDDEHVSETEDRVGVTWDDTPEPGLERFEDNVFAFGAPRSDDDPTAESGDAAAADEVGTDEPVGPTEPMFKKKSNLTLPTIGVDAADWYGEDEPDSEA